MGRIHALATDFRPSDHAFRRQQWHEEETLRLEQYIPASETAVHENATALFARLHALPRDRSSYGLTHGDLHHNNFQLDKGVIHPFDFDDCEYSWFASDVAIALYYAAGFDTTAVLARWTGMDRRSFSSHFLEHFMAGYRTEHRLDPDWLRPIPDFLRLRALIMYVIGLQHLDLNSLTQSERKDLMFHRDAIVDDAWTDLSLD
jgi:Ser/Thr protein kinase RdoA (MazF antagonist)